MNAPATLLLLVATLLPVPGAARITREDLARSLLRLEQALASHPPAPELRGEVERRFDRLTASFFLGAHARALHDLDALTLELDPERSVVVDLLPLALACEPAWTRPGEDPPRVVARTLYASGTGEARPAAELVLRDGRGELLASRAVDPGAGAWDLPLPAEGLPASDLPEGTYSVTLEREGRGGGAASWTLAATSPHERAAALLARVRRGGLDEGLAPAARVLAARCELLDAPPSPMRSAEYLLEADPFARELEAEWSALRSGLDPYVGRQGTWWLELEGVPTCVVAPTVEGPLPVVLAFHGAGGDEWMFPRAYGGGELARLAREHGFLLVCPNTYEAPRGAEGLGRLVQALERWYPVDRERIALVGHSMGSGPVLAALREAPGRWLGAVVVGGRPPLEPVEGLLPPCTWYHGALDGVVPAGRGPELARGLRAAGHPLEYHLLEDRGHTLLVPEVLAPGLARLGLLRRD